MKELMAATQITLQTLGEVGVLDRRRRTMWAGIPPGAD
jgi:hypothetical protein